MGLGHPHTVHWGKPLTFLQNILIKMRERQEFKNFIQECEWTFNNFFVLQLSFLFTTHYSKSKYSCTSTFHSAVIMSSIDYEYIYTSILHFPDINHHRPILWAVKSLHILGVVMLCKVVPQDWYLLCGVSSTSNEPCALPLQEDLLNPRPLTLPDRNRKRKQK